MTQTGRYGVAAILNKTARTPSKRSEYTSNRLLDIMKYNENTIDIPLKYDRATIALLSYFYRIAIVYRY